ncbi:MAG: ribonuclease R [Thomasclavelia sp.]|nr:ribonuclease R [Thomasclavelia sp.]
MDQRIIELLKNEELTDRTVDGIAKQLNITKSGGFVGLVKELNSLESEGIIVRSKHNHYFLPSQNNMVVGTLSINKKGFGFVSVEGRENDVFISNRNLKDAFNSDEVLVELLNKQEGKNDEGTIVRVIKRGQTKIVGEVTKGKRDLLVIPDDPKFKKMIVVDKAHAHGAMPGHKVVVAIKSYKPFIKGDIETIIGHKLDPGVDIASVVHEYQAPIDFEKEIYDYIEGIADTVDESDFKNRVDMRSETVVTIDGDDAKDLDDGISLTRMDNGHYKLGVHIADVSYYVKEGSVLDKEALNRSTSIYLVDRVIPMLPHKLSNGICSLNPHVDRFAISCMMEVDEQGVVVNHDILPTIINSTERMTYSNVNAILKGDNVMQTKYSHVLDLFFLMQELANILAKKKARRGAIDFDVEEAKVIVDDKGKPIDVKVRERGASDHIIEEFMLLANETIAEHFKWLDLPFIYRVHEYPKEKKLQQFSVIARSFGYTIKGSLDDIHPKEVCAIIDASKGRPEHTIISTLLLRCMQKARYDAECLGHFGLADEFYTHFTSPIRRYPDLMVHRLIRKYLFEKHIDNTTIKHYAKIMPEIAMQTSTCERRAIDIERAVDDMKIAEYMEKHIGDEYEGIISSVTNFGIFVELPNTIEGLVRMEDLTDDYYFFDEKTLTLRGQRTGKRFKMSDKIKVRVLSASKANRSVDFEVVGIKSNRKPGKEIKLNNRHSSKNHSRKESYDFNKHHHDDYKRRNGGKDKYKHKSKYHKHKR